MIATRRRRFMNEINVVPYIDVMLVLLIIFMVTAPLVNPGQIELPSVGENLAAPVAPLQITIKGKKRYSLQNGPGKSTEATPGNLISKIKSMQSSPDQAVVIAAAGKSSYQDVMDVIDVLQQNQIKKVGLLTKPSGK